MNKNNHKYTWFNTILTVLISTVLVAIIISVNKYGSLYKRRFIFINIALLIGTLIIILLTVKFNNSTKKTPKTIYSVILVLLLLGSGYGLYITNIVDTTIKVITTEDSKIEYFASFVVYNSELEDVDQLKYKTMGIIESDEFIEGNVLPKAELKKLEFDNVKFKSYQSYTSLINALVKNEVDFVSLPKDYKNLYSTNEELLPILPDTKSIHDFSGKYDNVSKISGSDIDVTQVPFTVLLMGNDGGRTDTLMLASVNPKAMQVTLTSIARDSYVPIACYPGQTRDKINHSRSISRDCTIRTVEDMLDISIDFFVEINFQGVVDLVDSLGTLTIDSPASFHGNIETGEGGGVYIPEGVSDLDGNQVLAFVRERNSFLDGDFQRQLNQQQVIDVLLSTVIETRDVNKLINLIKATGRNVETNMSLSQLIDLMNLGIAKMESTFLNNAEIFTIYGNRVTGRGVLIYNPDYDLDIYYYVLYNGSISDTKDFIAMNLRSDGILEIPQGFNYNYNIGFIPPVFTIEEYYEAIDSDVNLNVPRPEPEEEEEEEENEEETEEKPIEQGTIMVENFAGKPLSELKAFADENGFYLEEKIVEKITNKKDEANLHDKLFVFEHKVGFLNEGDTLHVTITKWKYVKDEETTDPEVNPDPGDGANKDDSNGSSGDKGNGNSDKDKEDKDNDI